MKLRTRNIRPPPIVQLMRAAQPLVGSPSFVNMGQGAPGHIPPRNVLDALADQIHSPFLHGYTADQGLLELREELALYLRRAHEVHADPEDEIVITAGGNQALAGALMTIVEPGDNVIVLDPYYFNSYMAIQLTGATPRAVPVETDFQPSVESVSEAVDEHTRAIVMVSPNNPTGAVYSEDVVNGLVDLCLERGVFLISDETYARFVYDDMIHHSPRRRRDAEENVILLGSFSKDFGIPGWRVGYVVASSSFVQEYMKVQDTVTICAPTAGQVLALEMLRRGEDHVLTEVARIGRLRRIAYSRASEIDALETVRTSGTFYLFPRVRGCADSQKLVLDILEKTSVLVLPGSVFGEAGEGHLRISIAHLTSEAINEAFDRLGRFFSVYGP